jgi:hypothetical protein
MFAMLDQLSLSHRPRVTETQHPVCPACCVPMWLARTAWNVAPRGVGDRVYECQNCGLTRTYDDKR